jgi:FSR family fosmidomycin resistance protein-like MFS transporter
MRAAGPAPVPASTGDAQHWTQIARRLLSVVVLAFVLLVAVRSSIQATYQFLLPKLLEDRGWEASVYGALAGVFMGTAAVGNVIVGKLADRFGMRVVTTAALLLSVPTGLLLLTTPSTLLAFVACGLTGFLTGGLHSVLVVHAQQLLPVRQGFAAGLILGFTFASGAIGTWVCGFVGDIVGLQPAMQGLALMGVPAALLALALPKHLPGEGGEDAEEVDDVLVGGGPQPAAR